jgi:hypothetical protein
MIPIGGSSPGEIDANARPCSPVESEITTRVDRRRDENGNPEHERGQPEQGKTVQPCRHAVIFLAAGAGFKVERDPWRVLGYQIKNLLCALCRKSCQRASINLHALSAVAR